MLGREAGCSSTQNILPAVWSTTAGWGNEAALHGGLGGEGRGAGDCLSLSGVGGMSLSRGPGDCLPLFISLSLPPTSERRRRRRRCHAAARDSPPARNCSSTHLGRPPDDVFSIADNSAFFASGVLFSCFASSFH